MTVTPEAGGKQKSANEQNGQDCEFSLFISTLWLPSCLGRYRHLLTCKRAMGMEKQRQEMTTEREPSNRP